MANLLSILLIGGAGAYLLTSAKKKKKAEPAVTPGETTFDWTAAYQVAEGNLGATLTRLSSGGAKKNGVDCFWSTAAIDPPIDQGAYGSFIICPATNEKAEFFGATAEEVKAKVDAFFGA